MWVDGTLVPGLHQPVKKSENRDIMQKNLEEKMNARRDARMWNEVAAYFAQDIDSHHESQREEQPEPMEKDDRSISDASE